MASTEPVFDRVCHGDHPSHLAIHCHDHDRFGFGLQALDRRFETVQTQTALVQAMRRLPTITCLSVHLRPLPPAPLRPGSLAGRIRLARAPRPRPQSLHPADVRCLFRPRRPGAAARSRPPDQAARDDVGHRRLAAGDRAGLIQHHGGEPAGAFEGFAVLEQDAQLGAFAGADHHGGGGRQAHRARAGDHQHRHRVDQGAGKDDSSSDPAGSGIRKYQTRKVSSGHADDDRDEDGRDVVGQFLDRRLAGLRIFHQADDLRQRGLFAHPGGLKVGTGRSC